MWKLCGILMIITASSFIGGSLSSNLSKRVNELENAILLLEQMPYRCPERKRGVYANRGYRQLFVKNYTVIYRVDEKTRTVLIVTVRYSPSQF